MTQQDLVRYLNNQIQDNNKTILITLPGVDIDHTISSISSKVYMFWYDHTTYDDEVDNILSWDSLLTDEDDLTFQQECKIRTEYDKNKLLNIVNEDKYDFIIIPYRNKEQLQILSKLDMPIISVHPNLEDLGIAYREDVYHYYKTLLSKDQLQNEFNTVSLVNKGYVRAIDILDELKIPRYIVK